MKSIVIRMFGSLVPGIIAAVGIALKAQGIGPKWLGWEWAALTGGVVFAAYVLWGWGQAEYKLFRRTRTEKYLTELSKLRTKGIELLDWSLHHIDDDSEIEIWWGSQAQPWHQSVEGAMSNIHPADPLNWRYLGTFEDKKFDGTLSVKLSHRLSILAIRLEKLERYINDRTLPTV